MTTQQPDALAADHSGDATDMVGRWYMLNKMGIATLCANKADAQQEAADAQRFWPHMGPHRAVQLVEAADVEAMRAGYAAARMEIESLQARIKTMAEERADELMVAHLDGRSQAAQQPAPSAAVALSDDLRDRLVAISGAVADQDDRAAQAMLREILKAPQPTPTPQAGSQPAPVLDMAVMQLAESVGLIGPASRTHDLHAAVQRFHDLICVNATIKAAVMAADAIRGAATSARYYPPLPMQFACSGVFPVYSADQIRAYADETCAIRAAQPVGAQQPGDCGNTPYDEGPFTLAQQPGVAYAALPDAEIDRIVPALEPVSEDFPAEWAVWKDRERIREELRASYGQAPAQAAPVTAPVATVAPRSNTGANLRAPNWQESELPSAPTESQEASMALSKTALKRVIDSVPEPDGDDVGKWVVGVCRAIEAEVRKQDEALIRQLVEALEDFDDAGPLGEGWKSDRLLSLLASARARLEGKP